MKKWILLMSMLGLVGCAPKKRDADSSMDEFVRPLYNVTEINQAIDATHGVEVDERKLGAGAAEVAKVNDPSAQNIVMYSGMHKEQDPKDVKNCFKDLKDGEANQDYKKYYNEDRVQRQLEVVGVDNIRANVDDMHNHDQKENDVLKRAVNVYDDYSGGDHDYFNDEDRLQKFQNAKHGYHNSKADYLSMKENMQLEKQYKSKYDKSGYDQFDEKHAKYNGKYRRLNNYKFNDNVLDEVSYDHRKYKNNKGKRVYRKKTNSKKYCIKFRRKSV